MHRTLRSVWLHLIQRTAQRHRVSLSRVGDRFESFPIFPLPLVLLPSELAPLHIFEERYKQMINRCIDEATEFGIVWLGDDGLAEVGCTARITELIDRMEDGRMNIVVRGGQPFKLLRRVDDLAYPAGDIELLEDEEDASDAHAEAARTTYAQVVEKATDERPGAEDLADMDAYGMAATIELEPALKQKLLASRSEDERLGIVQDLFVKAVERLERAEHVSEVARSNGKVHF
jgi:Lon protease-like protein